MAVVETWRELDSRMTGEGEQVSLMWSPETQQVLLLVEDESAVIPPAQARDAFEHPYCYLEVA